MKLGVIRASGAAGYLIPDCAKPVIDLVIASRAFVTPANLCE
jgi:hypothetical protein